LKIKFCGAARTVTGSAHLLTLDDGYKILLDCGLYQGREEKFHEYNGEWFFKPSEINCLVLSHAHIDHCGRIPKLVKDGFTGKIYSTSATRDLCAIMLLDSAKIQENDAEYLNRKSVKKGLVPDAKPLYTAEDVIPAIEKYVGIGYRNKYYIHRDVTVEFRDCGHILGSASVTLEVKSNDGKTSRIGFSGDIGRPSRPILRDPYPMEDLNYLICESTYGGEKNKSLPHDYNGLLQIIMRTCVQKKGKLIIPAFSVGRTQEVVYTLDKLATDGRLPDIPVYVDSPLAVNATEIFRMHPDCFDSDIREYMLVDPNPFGFNKLKYIRDVNESKKLNDMDGPAVIISASGMMTGGRIIHHVFNNISNPRNTVLFIGYCAPHTLGYRIRNGDKKVKIFGKTLKVKAEIEIMDSYSAHGDEDEIIAYLYKLDRKKLDKIFLVHGDYDRQQKLAITMRNNGFKEIIIPKLKDQIII